MKSPLVKPRLALHKQRYQIVLNPTEKSLLYLLVLGALVAGVVSHTGTTSGWAYLFAGAVVLVFCSGDLIIGGVFISFFASTLGRLFLTINGLLLTILFVMSVPAPSGYNSGAVNLVFSFLTCIELYLITSRYKWIPEAWLLIFAGFLQVMLNITLLSGWFRVIFITFYLLVLLVAILWIPGGARHFILSPFLVNLRRLPGFHLSAVWFTAVVIGLLVLLMPASAIYHYLFEPAKEEDTTQKPPPNPGINRPGFTPERLSLREMAGLKSEDSVVMTVRLSNDKISNYRSDKPLYFRGKVFEKYMNGAWSEVRLGRERYLLSGSEGFITVSENAPNLKYERLEQFIKIPPEYPALQGGDEWRGGSRGTVVPLEQGFPKGTASPLGLGRGLMPRPRKASPSASCEAALYYAGTTRGWCYRCHS